MFLFGLTGRPMNPCTLESIGNRWYYTHEMSLTSNSQKKKNKVIVHF